MRSPLRVGWMIGAALVAAGCNRMNSPPSGEGSVGNPAPPTHGTDADGVAFQLSDYRGKVVMLDFWGNW